MLWVAIPGGKKYPSGLIADNKNKGKLTLFPKTHPFCRALECGEFLVLVFNLKQKLLRGLS